MESIIPDDRLHDLEDRLGVLMRLDEAQPKLPMVEHTAEPTVDGQPSTGLRPPGIICGITVAQAAHILRVEARRVLDLLPVNYTSATIISNEYECLRLSPLWLKNISLPSHRPLETQVSNTFEWRNHLGEQLLRRIHQPDFSRAKTMVEKYALFLSELLKLSPNAAKKLLAYRPRSRCHFAYSQDEIMRDHPYASVRRLGAGGLYAMCTLSNDSKLNVLRNILHEERFSPGEINRLLGEF